MNKRKKYLMCSKRSGSRSTDSLCVKEAKVSRSGRLYCENHDPAIIGNLGPMPNEFPKLRIIFGNRKQGK